MPTHRRHTAPLAILASTVLLLILAPAPAAVAVAHTTSASLNNPPTPGAVDLRPKFKRGEQIRYTLTLDSLAEVKSPQLPELDQKQEMRQQIDLVVRVVEAGTDGSTIELVYDRVKVSFESDAFSAEYDSANPKPTRTKPSKTKPSSPNSPANQDPATTPSPTDILSQTDDEFFATAMQGIAGTVVTIELDASGNIRSVSGAASLTPGGGLPAIGGHAGGSWLVSSPGQSGYARPGETWTTTSSLGNTPLGNFTMVTNYTLRSAAGGRATIAISGGIDAASAPGTPGQTAGAQIRDSKYSGTCIWDTARGQLREMQTTQSATIEGTSMGVPVTMRSSSDVRVKRTR